MLFKSVDDFLNEKHHLSPFLKQEEVAAARALFLGSEAEKATLYGRYLAFVRIKFSRLPKNLQTLELVYRCQSELTRAMEGFDFEGSKSPFSRILSLRLNKLFTEYLAELPSILPQK